MTEAACIHNEEQELHALRAEMLRREKALADRARGARMTGAGEIFVVAHPVRAARAALYPDGTPVIQIPRGSCGELRGGPELGGATDLDAAQAAADTALEQWLRGGPRTAPTVDPAAPKTRAAKVKAEGKGKGKKRKADDMPAAAKAAASNVQPSTASPFNTIIRIVFPHRLLLRVAWAKYPENHLKEHSPSTPSNPVAVPFTPALFGFVYLLLLPPKMPAPSTTLPSSGDDSASNSQLTIALPAPRLPDVLTTVARCPMIPRWHRSSHFPPTHVAISPTNGESVENHWLRCRVDGAPIEQAWADLNPAPPSRIYQIAGGRCTMQDDLDNAHDEKARMERAHYIFHHRNLLLHTVGRTSLAHRRKIPRCIERRLVHLHLGIDYLVSLF
ncbi:hypothetical protein B0H14DRAFT_2654906 [Mycena olivaceomarginata]|nr:hypothetical protein B0H14DRAFT_2654906 [Mycena olivaceomarginata]